MQGFPATYPPSHDSRMVWNPMPTYTFDEIKNHFSESPKDLSFKPLMEASGMSIEEYTRHPSCIELPLDLWPLP